MDEKPITDKENFPTEEKQRVLFFSTPTYQEGYIDGYRSCLTLILSFLIVMVLVESFRK